MSYNGHMIKPKNMTGEEFKSFYTGLGYSQKQFAEILDYDPRQLRRWECGERDIPRYILFALEGLRHYHKKFTGKNKIHSEADIIAA